MFEEYCNSGNMEGLKFAILGTEGLKNSISAQPFYQGLNSKEWDASITAAQRDYDRMMKSMMLRRVIKELKEATTNNKPTIIIGNNINSEQTTKDEVKVKKYHQPNVGIANITFRPL